MNWMAYAVTVALWLSIFVFLKVAGISFTGSPIVFLLGSAATYLLLARAA